MESNISQNKHLEGSQTIISPEQTENPIINNPKKIKPILKKSVIWYCSKDSEVNAINKYKPKILSRITLAQNGFKPRASIRNLTKALSDAKNISSVIIDEKKFSAKHLSLLLNSINHPKKLRLTLNPNKFELSKESVKNLIQTRRFRFLSDFEGSLGYSKEDLLGAVPPRNRKMVDGLCKQLKGLPNLKTLNLNTCFWISQLPSSSLTSLKLSLSQLAYDREEFQKLASKIQQCHHLESLEFEFDPKSEGHHFGGRNIDLPEARAWASLFEKIPKLKVFKISRVLTSLQKPEAIQIFLEGLKYLKQLTILDLQFGLGFGSELLPLANTLFSSLAISLPSVTQLEKLKLDLSAFLHVETTDFRSFKSALQYLSALKDIHLTLPKIVPSDDCIFLLAQTLQGFADLKTLTILFSDKDINLESLAFLSNSIPHKNLTSLVLNTVSRPDEKKNNSSLSFNQITKSIASLWPSKKISFFSNLSQFNLLELFTSDLEIFDMSNAEWKYFALGLKELKHLKSLNLKLPKFDSSNNFEDLRSVMSSLQGMPKLEILKLSFFGKNMSDQQIEHISLNLAACKELKSFSLEVTVAKNLSKKSLDSLGSGLQELTLLNSLNLIFDSFSCPVKPFSTKDMDEFWEGLSVLKNLKNIRIFTP